jgi:hypothetical protein
MRTLPANMPDTRQRLSWCVGPDLARAATAGGDVLTRPDQRVEITV